MRRLLPFIAFAAWILVAGCGGKVSVKAERQANTGILPSEQIVVLLLRYHLEGNQVRDLGSTERRFEHCIRTEMQRVKDDLTFLPPATLRKLVSADTIAALTAHVADDATQSPESLLPLLGEPVTAKRLAEEKVRYVVLLVANYSTSESKWGVGGGSAGIAIGKEWKQYSSIQATVLDLKHARIAGSASSSSTGTEAAGGGVFIIIPFPIYFSSMTESGACAALGKELARFVLGTGAP